MLNHTSGLCNVTDMLQLREPDGTGGYVNQDIVDMAARQRSLNFAPGSNYSYSNTGYLLLARIAEKVSGSPISKFTSDRIFKPLGMNNTGWRTNVNLVIPDRASAYKNGAAWVLSVPADNVHGSGGLLTTAGDLLI
jgi:CubicO group peptidase (beta-lactamase class C family)